MLSVRGKGLLSVCRDDNFIVDDDPTSSSEVLSFTFISILLSLVLFIIIIYFSVSMPCF